MLECVINVSEGRDVRLIEHFGSRAGSSLLDIHSDIHHNRSVFTLGGATVLSDALALTRSAVDKLDLGVHRGAHPRVGVVDVVPFVPLGDDGFAHPLNLEEAILARDQFARTVGKELALPCFLYGPERTLPAIRRSAFVDLVPDFGPMVPHPSAGACCVGARGALIAYNVNISGVDIATTKHIATLVRSPRLRTLGFALGETLQVSCNLVDPAALGIEQAYDLIAVQVLRLGGAIQHGELVGLVPEQALNAVPRDRWEALGLSREATIEFRLDRQRPAIAG